ncbi:hypothetical protein GQ457_06G026690 [Hibiscus cannabinus]
MDEGFRSYLSEFCESLKSVLDSHFNNQTLLVTIHHAIWPITQDVLHRVFSPYGSVKEVVPFQKSIGVQFLVQYQGYGAIAARSSLQGRNIYDGCCQLDIQIWNDKEVSNSVHMKLGTGLEGSGDLKVFDKMVVKENEAKDVSDVTATMENIDDNYDTSKENLDNLTIVHTGKSKENMAIADSDEQIQNLLEIPQQKTPILEGCGDLTKGPLEPLQTIGVVTSSLLQHRNGKGFPTKTTMLLEQSHDESDEIVCDTKIMKISFVAVFDPGICGDIVALATSLGEAEYGFTVTKKDEYSGVEVLKQGKVNKPVVTWVSGTCAALCKLEAQFDQTRAMGGSGMESSQTKSQTLKEVGVEFSCSYEVFEISIKEASEKMGEQKKVTSMEKIKYLHISEDLNSATKSKKDIVFNLVLVVHIIDPRIGADFDDDARYLEDAYDRYLNSDDSNKDNEFSSLFHPVSCEIFKNFKIFSSVESEPTQLLQKLTFSSTLWLCVSCEGSVHTFRPPLTYTFIDVLRAYLLSNIVLDPQLIGKTHNTCLAPIGRDKVENSEKRYTNSSSIIGSVASGVNEFADLIEQDVIYNFVLKGIGIQYPKREGKRCVLGTLFSMAEKYWVLTVFEYLATLMNGVKIFTGTNDLKYLFGTYIRPNIGGKIIKLYLAAKPSQLEVVDLVVAGKIKAQQCYSSDVDTAKNMVISNHGNDYFVGQGIGYVLHYAGKLDYVLTFLQETRNTKIASTRQDVIYFSIYENKLKAVLLVHILFSIKAKRAWGHVWSNHRKKKSYFNP